jgi:hypothetical protein
MTAEIRSQFWASAWSRFRPGAVVVYNLALRLFYDVPQTAEIQPFWIRRTSDA